MNERIKELRGQALRWSGENVNRNLYSNYEIEQKEYDKFAELIVRECANIADIAEPYLASDLIKEQFGIKE